MQAALTDARVSFRGGGICPPLLKSRPPLEVRLPIIFLGWQYFFSRYD